MCYSSIIVCCCVDVTWRVGIVEGYGQRVPTGVLCCEGEEVTTGWLNCIMGSFFTVQQVLRWIWGSGNVAYMSGGKMYWKRWLWMAKGKARVEDGDRGKVAWDCTLWKYRVCVIHLAKDRDILIYQTNCSFKKSGNVSSSWSTVIVLLTTSQITCIRPLWPRVNELTGGDNRLSLTWWRCTVCGEVVKAVTLKVPVVCCDVVYFGRYQNNRWTSCFFIYGGREKSMKSFWIFHLILSSHLFLLISLQIVSFSLAYRPTLYMNLTFSPYVLFAVPISA
jgi:hypothetical protein